MDVVGIPVASRVDGDQVDSQGDGDQVDSQGHFPDSSLDSESENAIPVPTYKIDQFYNMKHKRRGVAIIFNHENFIDSLTAPKRVGTKEDCSNLEVTLQSLGFEVIRHDDLNLEDLIAEIKKISKTDYSDCDCIFIFVLSHGERELLYAKDSVYSPNILFDPFTPDKCPSLAGKPKLFMIQACQGKKLDPGVNVRTVQVDSDNGHSKYRIPLHADFLVAYATIPGYYSWRNPDKGSWFIRALCKELRQYWKVYDFLTILTFVNGRVACNFESYVPDKPYMHGQKQIPCIITRLTRLLKFQTIEDDVACNDSL